MDSTNILEIKNLFCSYSRKKEDSVLFIEDLNLPSGKVIFLLGASGSGKSTLLETIGLMNDTIADGTVKLFGQNTLLCDYAQLWKDNNLIEISTIRKNYLSFIFQNTNLMENFTAYENICLSQMIKTNGKQSIAIDGAISLMNEVGLPLKEVGLNKLSVNLSGGQRQRVSFVRALNNNYKLLLCDEPTGNLDEVNAVELLKIVRDNIGDHKTAIIVSHDINLAIKYADQIVLITKNLDKGYGEILQKNIFLRNEWTDYNEFDLSKFRSQLLSQFEVKKEKAIQKDGITNSKKLKETTYKQLFASKEGSVLFGRSKINLIILISILSITFIAIGFANGALDYMNTKFKDPFVNLLTIGIPWSKSSSSTVRDITDNLNSDEIRNGFLIDTVTAYKETPLPIFNLNDGKSEFIKGRLVSTDDPINKYLFDPSNVISGAKAFNDDSDLGMVVTEKLLKRLGYKSDAKVIYIDNDDSDTTGKKSEKFKVPVPIRAVLKAIPGRNHFLVTNFFFVSYINHEECVFDFTEQRKRILFFVENDKNLAKSLGKEIEKLMPLFILNEEVPIEQLKKFTDNSDDLDYDSDHLSDAESDIDLNESPEDSLSDLISTQTISYRLDIRSNDTCEVMNTAGYEVSVNFDSKPYYYATTEIIYKQIINSDFYKNNQAKITRIFDYNIAPQLEEEFSNDYLCINFKPNGLDSIESFSRFIVNNLNAEKVKEQANVIDVDAAAIKEKKNFNYMSKMTWLISGLLIAFSILSISLFISNLLKTHLNKVKMNLGTYKAFGLSDKESVSIYMGIMLKFILLGLVISLALALVLGWGIGLWFGSILNIDDNVQYFKLFAGQTYFLIFIILLVTVITSYFNINRILSKTPGDLIYNR